MRCKAESDLRALGAVALGRRWSRRHPTGPGRPRRPQRRWPRHRWHWSPRRLRHPPGRTPDTPQRVVRYKREMARAGRPSSAWRASSPTWRPGFWRETPPREPKAEVRNSGRGRVRLRLCLHKHCKGPGLDRLEMRDHGEYSSWVQISGVFSQALCVGLLVLGFSALWDKTRAPLSCTSWLAQASHSSVPRLPRRLGSLAKYAPCIADGIPLEQEKLGQLGPWSAYVYFRSWPL